MNVTHFSLRNGGGFVCRLHILVRRYTGAPGVFEPEVEVPDGNDIVLGQEKASHLGYGPYGIPEGSRVRLKAHVIGGNDNIFDQPFIYREKAGTAAFVITGTTLDNHLGMTALPRPPSAA